MKKNIDELDILQVEEFQDYQVADVVAFSCKYPKWDLVLPSMLHAIKTKKVTGDSDFELLCNAYVNAWITFQCLTSKSNHSEQIRLVNELH